MSNPTEYPPPPQAAYPPPQYPPMGYPYAQPYPTTPPPGPKPDHHWGWCVVACLFWPLAIPAFINANKIDQAWNMGDWNGAQVASDNAKKFGRIALFVFIGITAFILIIFLIVMGLALRYS